MKHFLKTMIAVWALTLFASSALAMLPPYWDSVRQMETVLHSAGLDQKLHGEVVSVEKIGNLQFLVRTHLCAASVSLVAKTPNVPMATSYDIKAVDHLMCK